MIYVYKQSPTPLQPWDYLRHGGPNNIAPEVKAKYLLLLNADILQRDGVWHYIFEFDTRDSLKKSGLAQLTQGPGKSNAYPDGMDWRTWLAQGEAPAGEDGAAMALPSWQIITPDVRWEILHMPAGDNGNGRHDVVITGLRPLTGTPGSANGHGAANGFAPSPRALPAAIDGVPAPLPNSKGKRYVQSRMFDDENLLLALPSGA